MTNPSEPEDKKNQIPSSDGSMDTSDMDRNALEPGDEEIASFSSDDYLSSVDPETGEESFAPETVDEYSDSDATRMDQLTRSGALVSDRTVFYRPILIGLAGPNKGMRHQINNHITIVGRSSSSTWKLNDHTASRQHFRIIYENHIAPDQVPACVIEDLGSRNGTEVNGEKIPGRTVLNERDRIIIGTSVIGFFVRDDEELKQDQSLYLNATQDPLTGLKNRRVLQQYLKYHIKQADKYGLPLSMILIDIDFFKKVNDTYGHDVGDDALCHLSDILRVSCREDDLLSRWGGEEFGIAMSGVNADHAKKLAERLREATESTPMAIGGEDGKEEGELQMTISIGGAQYIPGETVEKLFNRCDQGLYEAKRNGRNKVVFL